MKCELEIEIDRLCKIIRKEASDDHQRWLRKVGNSDPVLGLLLNANDILPVLKRRHKDMQAALAHLSRRPPGRRRSDPPSRMPALPSLMLPPPPPPLRFPRVDPHRFPGL